MNWWLNPQGSWCSQGVPKEGTKGQLGRTEAQRIVIDVGRKIPFCSCWSPGYPSPPVTSRIALIPAEVSLCCLRIVCANSVQFAYLHHYVKAMAVAGA